MTDEMKEGTADRPSNAAALFGRIVLKNRLVEESDLRKVMSTLAADADLGGGARLGGPDLREPRRGDFSEGRRAYLLR